MVLLCVSLLFWWPELVRCLPRPGSGGRTLAGLRPRRSHSSWLLLSVLINTVYRSELLLRLRSSMTNGVVLALSQVFFYKVGLLSGKDHIIVVHTAR